MKDNEMQRRVLGCLGDVLGQNGYRAELVDATDHSLLMLRAESGRVGKAGATLTLELCFVPVALPREEEGLLQFYVTLFSDLPEKYSEAVAEAVEYCNDYALLGHFGFFEPAGQVYLKYAALVDGSPAFEKVIANITDNISVLVAAASRFVDALDAAGHRGETVERLVEQGLLPKM